MDWLDLTQLIEGNLTMRAAAQLQVVAPQFNDNVLAILNKRCPAGTLVDVNDITAALLEEELGECVGVLTHE